MMRPAILGVALVFASACGLAATDEPRYQVHGHAGVYYGDADEFSAPAQVEAARVFARIPEYQEIQRRRLTRTEPEYAFLLEKANRRFFKAVHQVARQRGHDLVAEPGTVTSADGAALPDCTEAAISACR